MQLSLSGPKALWLPDGSIAKILLDDDPSRDPSAEAEAIENLSGVGRVSVLTGLNPAQLLSRCRVAINALNTRIFQNIGSFLVREGIHQQVETILADPHIAPYERTRSNVVSWAVALSKISKEIALSRPIEETEFTHPEREKAVVNSAIQMGERYGVPPRLAEEIAWELIRRSKLTQHDVLKVMVRDQHLPAGALVPEEKILIRLFP